MGNRKWTKEEDLLLEQLFFKRIPFKNVAVKLNRTISAIKNRTKLLKLKRINVIEDFFERNDEVSNYILGYWLADGYISHRGGGHYFSLASIDYEHLCNIRSIMGIKTRFSYDNDCHILVVGNKKLYQSLLNLGATPRKTHTISIMDIKFNPIYFYDFLRGYFDGDGSLPLINRKIKNGEIKTSLGCVKFTGSKKIIFSLYDKIKDDFKCTVSEDKRSEKNNCFYLIITGENSRRFLHKIYGNNPSLFLKRKYDRYIKYVLKINI